MRKLSTIAAFFLCALAWALPEPAHANCTAPCTKAQITTDVNTNMADNTIGLVTPAIVRSLVIETINSYLDINASSSFTCPTHQFQVSIATLSTYTCAQPAATDVSGLAASATTDTTNAGNISSGTLAIARGGTGQGTAATAISALMPTPTRAGDVAIWNGSNWSTVAGNNSGTGTFQEDGSGNGAFNIIAAGAAGQLPATTTNDNASAGNVGQYKASNCPSATATVTITIAAPGVITWTGHPFVNSAINTDTCPVVFTTSGALPTGITAGTTYYVVPSSITTNTFEIATSVANALAPTPITTTGTQSGTQTGTANVGLSNGVAKDLTGLSLGAGDWDVSGMCANSPGASTTTTQMVCNVTTTSGTLNSTPGDANAIAFSGTQAAGVAAFLPTSTGRFSLSGSTTVWLVVQSSFAVSTMAAYGTLRARRVR